jgi:PAS domain S-box-containing protein
MNRKDTHGPRARKTIKLRLVIYYSVLIVVILSAVGLTANLGLPFFSYGGRRSLERERIFNHLNLVADLKKERLVHWLDERNNDAVILSNSETVSRTLSAILSALANPTANETQEETLRKIAHENPDYQSLVTQLRSVKDTYGVCDAVAVADANTGIFVASTDSTDLGVDVSQHAYFKSGLQTLDTFICNLANHRHIESPIFHISRRVKDESGVVIGVLVMTVVTDNIMTQVLQTGGGLGETGEVLLVDQRARTMANLKYPLPTGQTITPLDYSISAKPAVLAASGEEGVIESRDYRDVPVFAAFRHIRIRPDGGWGLVVKLDKAELFAPMWRGITHESIVGLIGILAAILLTYILANKISTPISHLSDTARKILAGHLTSRAHVTQDDEVGLLAETFNTMLDRLQHAQEVLEERVRNRTTELQSANDSLVAEMTIRQKAMDELASSEARYQDLYDNSPDMYLSVDASTAKISRCNQTLASVIGYTKDEIIGRSVFDLYDPDYLPKAKAAFQTFTRIGKLTNYEMQLRRKDGSKIDVMLNVIAVRDDEGNIIESRSAWRDITERKQSQMDLHASEEKFRTVFNKTPACIAVTSYPEGQFLEINQSFEDTLGYSREELLRTTAATLQLYKNPNERDRVVQALQGAGYVHIPDLSLVTKSGDTIVVDNHLTLNHINGEDSVVSVFTNITERSVLEEKLRVSEEKYSRTFDLSPACVTLTTFPGGEYIDVNQAFEQIFGHSKEEVIGRTVVDIDLYENLDDRKRNQANFRKSGFIHVPEMHLVSKSGTPVIVDSRASLIEIDNEQFAISVFFDVSERIRADKDLKNAKDHAENLIETANVMVVELDTDGFITTFNRKAEEITGYTMSELNERNWFEVLVPRDRYPEVWDEFESVMSDTPRKNFENPILTKDGVERHISWQNSQLHEFGDVVGTLSFGVDITEQKKADIALRRSEEKYRTLFEMMFNGFALHKIILDDEGRPCDYRFIDINPAFERLTGMHPGNVIGKTALELLPDLEPSWLERYGDVALTGKSIAFEEYSESLGKHFEVLAFSPEEMYFATLFSDITERKKAEEEIQHILHDLERSNKELEQFAYVASHDLQEPLRMVTSYTQLLAKRYQGQLDDSADEFISFAVDGATRMQALIEDLLMYSRVGRLDNQVDSVDCQQILGNVVLDLNTAIVEAEATVTYDNLPTITGNTEQLERLFRNLISNSLKFRGESAPIINIEAEMKEENWLFTLRDNGIGIDETHLERIFIIFQRLHSRDEYLGTGIGLAICKRIVEYHNGSIWAESQSGTGTDIYFTIPVASRKEDS